MKSHLDGKLGDIIKNPTLQNLTGDTPETVNYAEMVNRSENGTALAKANYT